MLLSPLVHSCVIIIKVSSLTVCFRFISYTYLLGKGGYNFRGIGLFVGVSVSYIMQKTYERIEMGFFRRVRDRVK